KRGTSNLAGYVAQLIRLDCLECLIRGIGTEWKHSKCKREGRMGIVPESDPKQSIKFILPAFVKQPQQGFWHRLSPCRRYIPDPWVGDACCQTSLEGRSARRPIATLSNPKESDSIRIDVTSNEEVVNQRRYDSLPVGSGKKILL